jgi:hypothetical protein
MQDLSGIGKSVNMGSENTPKACSMPVGSSASNNALCDRTDCPSYGKWYCPFTGW